ncbi:hypothetical protein CRYUN_Cryun26dG0110600 [Craigia yunnanensis]
MIFDDNLLINGELLIFVGNLSCSLTLFYASHCNIKGNIPSEIGNLSKLLWLGLDHNDLTGTIPTTIGRLRELQNVNLGNNKLEESISSELCHLEKLAYLTFTSNTLSGAIPACLGDLVSLRNLFLGSNNFTSIPSTLTRLDGAIPSSIADLIDLTHLSLFGNMLQSFVPQFFDELISLEYLDLSRNSLSGIIPKFLEHLSNLKYLNVSFNRLQREIPNGGSFVNYSSQSFTGNEALCGSSRFQVPPCKTDLSRETSNPVKVFNVNLDRALKSFDVECEILRNIRHRNLVKIISSCSNVDFKALVLEFMPNGSLEKWLYSHNHFLDVLQRLNVMIDIALALEYLHHGLTSSVVHCNLKPNNVLLDKDMIAHLGDFGIAKLLGEEDLMTQTMTLTTIGYMSPEYGAEGIISIKGEVYSFGILLMETFTRKKPIDKMFSGEMSLKEWVKQCLPSALIHVADTNLLSAREREHLAAKDCALSILQLGGECSSDLPEERIDMKKVVVKLKKIKIKFLKDIERARY